MIEKVTMDDVWKAKKFGEVNAIHFERLEQQLEAAENTIKRVAMLSAPLVEKYKPNHQEVMAINGTVNDYLRSK